MYYNLSIMNWMEKRYVVQVSEEGDPMASVLRMYCSCFGEIKRFLEKTREKFCAWELSSFFFFLAEKLPISSIVTALALALAFQAGRKQAPFELIEGERLPATAPCLRVKTRRAAGRGRTTQNRRAGLTCGVRASIAAV